MFTKQKNHSQIVIGMRERGNLDFLRGVRQFGLLASELIWISLNFLQTKREAPKEKY